MPAAPGTWISRCQVTLKVGKWGIPEKGFQNANQKCLFQVASALKWQLWPKPSSGNFAPCILPCKIGGSWNLMREWYLSKIPLLTFVYRSTCNAKLPGIFGSSKFQWTASALWAAYGYSWHHQTDIQARTLEVWLIPILNISRLILTFTMTNQWYPDPNQMTFSFPAWTITTLTAFYLYQKDLNNTPS